MSTPGIKLTEAEWNVMECLWEASPKTGRETAQLMQKRNGWSRSTTLTLLRRMEAKGAVICNDDGDIKTFSPQIHREDAALQETESLLGRIYNGSLSMLVSSMTQKQSLPQEEIDELYALLKNMEEGKSDG